MPRLLAQYVKRPALYPLRSADKRRDLLANTNETLPSDTERKIDCKDDWAPECGSLEEGLKRDTSLYVGKLG
jgi:hypothetical protein